MRADGEAGGAVGQSRQRVAAAFSLIATDDDIPRNAQLIKISADGFSVLQRQNFGRCHQNDLRAIIHRLHHRDKRHYGFAAAHIALQQAQHALGLVHIGGDIGQSFLLRTSEGEGQHLGQAGLQGTGARKTAPRRAPSLAAHQCQRELVRQQFIISQPRARRMHGRQGIGVFGLVHGAHGRVPRHPVLRRQPIRVLPFGKFGNGAQSGLHRLHQRFCRNARGQRINRLDDRQRVKIGLRQHVVGMGHL